MTNSSYQEHSNGSAGEESSQDISQVVPVLRHSDHTHQHDQAEKSEANSWLGKSCAFGLAHQRNVHLWKVMEECEDRSLFITWIWIT